MTVYPFVVVIGSDRVLHVEKQDQPDLDDPRIVGGIAFSEAVNAERFKDRIAALIGSYRNNHARSTAMEEPDEE